MSKRLVNAGADTPDTHCCNCGCGLFEFVPLRKQHLMPNTSALSNEQWFDLCGPCFQLEAALIQDSGTKEHPLRIAHYQRMLERYN